MPLIAMTGLMLIGPAGAQAATITATTTADNTYTMYFDGDEIVSTTYPGDGWGTAETSIFTAAEGIDHVIAIQAANHTPWGGANPAALLGEFVFDDGSGFLQAGDGRILTDGTWKIWTGGPQGTPALDGAGRDWTDPDYDDSDWAMAYQIGTHGMAPWGQIDGISDQATWIWTQNYQTDAADSPVYFRKQLTAVPEPLTMLTLLAGLGATGRYARRRRA
jgi:hypothetical protein